MTPFANGRRPDGPHGQQWLRALPQCAPKESPAYQRWYAGNVEGQRYSIRQPIAARPCACCGVEFVPRARNTKFRPQCQSAKYAARKRTARQLARMRGAA